MNVETDPCATAITRRSVVEEDVSTIVDNLGPVADALAGTTLLVTGAAGFLCSWLVDTVAAFDERTTGASCRVIALDNNVTGKVTRLERHATSEWLSVVEHDVSRPFEPEERVDWIVHGASIASPPTYRRFPLETIDVNVSGTRNVLDLARRSGARGVLHLSSSEVYGDPDPAFVPTSEDYAGRVSFTGPRACYDESKRLAETLCATYHRLYNLPVKVARPFNTYGPGQPLDDGRIIPDLMGSLVRRQPIRLYSDGRATRSFCYVTDAVRAFWGILVAGSAGEAYNVGNDGEEISIADLAERARHIGGPPPLDIVHARSEDDEYITDNPQRRLPDLAKIRSALGWEPRVTLQHGLERTHRSYLERGAS
jgi:nucleoside-diphosphate-sugar epimerase